jgi:NAD(P)-dependent dehydrogenase (short-subunit alcohol dehydrogenase family)
MTAYSFEHLNGRAAVITGAAGVIGRELALALGSVGVRTAILDLNGEQARGVAAEVRDTTAAPSIGIECNVLVRESVEEARRQVVEAFGPARILINGAGGNSPRATTEVESVNASKPDEWQKTFFGLDLKGFEQVYALNFTGTVLPTMVFARDMAEAGGGSVVNISSMSAYRPLTRIPAYSAAKASVNNFTEWLSSHLAPAGVRVNAIAPGFFLTRQNRFLLIDETTGQFTDRGRRIVTGTPMGRFGEVSELPGTVLFLVSDLAAFITGVIIPVDGGFNAFSGV